MNSHPIVSVYDRPNLRSTPKVTKDLFAGLKATPAFTIGYLRCISIDYRHMESYPKVHYKLPFRVTYNLLYRPSPYPVKRFMTLGKL